MDGDHGASARSDVEELGVSVASGADAHPRSGASERMPPAEAAFSDPIPGAREVTLEEMQAQCAADEQAMATRAARAVRDLVPDGNGGMRPRECTLRDNVAQAAAEGARPPRDLVLDGNGGMRVMDLDGESPPPIPKGRNREPPWDTEGGDDFAPRPFPWDGGDDVAPQPLVWAQSVVGSVDPEKGWSQRDGATLCVVNNGKRLLLIGGWDSSEAEHETWKLDTFATLAHEIRLDRTITTNEIWFSDDDGKTWEILLEHLKDPPKTGENARFQRVHTPAWTNCDDGYFYLIGGDVHIPHSEVWRTSRAGLGSDWQYMGDIDDYVPWEKRILSMAGSINGVLYVMGGQLTINSGTAQNDMYSSDTQGRTWKLVPSKPTWDMWSKRGMVFGMPVIFNTAKGRQELYLVGGGIYDSDPEVYFDDVYKFDGDDWIQVRSNHPRAIPPALPDPDGWPTGYDGPGKPSRSGRGYHNVVATPPGPGRPGWLLWVITGSVIGDGSCKKILVSDLVSKELGSTWTEVLTADWGPQTGSHADGVTVYKGDIIRASGAAADRSTYRISQVTLPEYFKKERPKITDVAAGSLGRAAFAGDVINLFGEGFSTVRAVYIYTADVNSAYTKFVPFSPSPTFEEALLITMPKVLGLKVKTRVYIIVVNADGSSDYPEGAISYLGPFK